MGANSAVISESRARADMDSDHADQVLGSYMVSDYVSVRAKVRWGAG